MLDKVKEVLDELIGTKVTAKVAKETLERIRSIVDSPPVAATPNQDKRIVAVVMTPQGPMTVVPDSK